MHLAARQSDRQRRQHGTSEVIVDHTRAVLDPDAPSVGMRATDTVVIPGPMYHSAPFGLAYQALGWGCHVVIMSRFDAAETLRIVQGIAPNGCTRCRR